MDTPSDFWLPSPDDITLADDEVHVWRTTLDLPQSEMQYLRRVLTSDELCRANRFHFERDRQHFIAGRGSLRVILGRYLQVGPERLNFDYNDYGKPFLASEFGQSGLNFNLSHSDGLVLYAVTRNREVGIDLERIRTDFAYEGIAKRFFSRAEVAALRTIPAKLKPIAFFKCWTRKEAYLKAQGKGLSLPLDSFDVAFAPNEPARLLATRSEPEEALRWTLTELVIDRGYIGALAVKGCNCIYKYWQWKA